MAQWARTKYKGMAMEKKITFYSKKAFRDDFDSRVKFHRDGSCWLNVYDAAASDRSKSSAFPWRSLFPETCSGT